MSARPYEEEASRSPAASEGGASGGDSDTDMAMEEAQEAPATPIKAAAAVATGRAARATKRDEEGSAAMKPGNKSTAAATGAGAGAKLGVRGGMIKKVGCHN